MSCQIDCAPPMLSKSDMGIWNEENDCYCEFSAARQLRAETAGRRCVGVVLRDAQVRTVPTANVFPHSMRPFMSNAPLRSSGYNNSNIELIDSYAAAWNARDLDRIMAWHTTDTEYEWHGSGSRDVGKAAVSKRFASQIAAMPDMHFVVVSVHVSDEAGVVESKIVGTLNGEPVAYEAADVITFRDGLVHTKDSYGVGRR